MITGDESATGDPLMVGGPQIGYFYPGFTYEMDMDAGDLEWRGATSVPFPGYLLIGRGEDFATTLTSASADVIDQFAETLCEGSDTKYKYKGECLDMELFEAGTLGGNPVEFYTTVHGPVIGYADGGRRARRDLVPARRLRRGRERPPLQPPHLERLGGELQGLLQRRREDAADLQLLLHRHGPRRRVHGRQAADPPQEGGPGPADQGHRQVRVAGRTSKKKDHPQGIDPEDGTMTNWNESVARGFAAADDNFGRNGSVMRVDLLDENLERLKGSDDKWSMAEVVSAMNAGATQDVRAIRTVPLLHELLTPGVAPSAEAQQALHIMVASGTRTAAAASTATSTARSTTPAPRSWTARGRRSRTRSWSRSSAASSTSSRRSSRATTCRPAVSTPGWHQYFDRDIRRAARSRR